MTLAIGIDLGTSGIKAVLMEGATRVLAQASRPLAVSIPHVGWSEQDPGLWVDAVFACLHDIAAHAPALMPAVLGIGLSGQMLSCLILDAAHRPLRPAMLWNDQRALAECATLFSRRPDIGQITNGTPDPGITAPKLLWLQQHEPRSFDAARMLLLTKDYVRLALTGDLASDPTDAGGTQLFNCPQGAWDESLCAAVGWNPAYLPPILNPWQAAGTLRPALATRWGLRAGLPVAAGAGDNMGSTLGAGAARPGDTVLTIGTSGVSCMVDAQFHPGPGHAILTSAHAAPGTYLSMGVVMAATAALDWTARLCGTSAAGLAAAAETFAASGTLAEAPVFLPTLNGIRTPLNRPDAMGQIAGLHPGVSPASLGYATLEGVAFQFAGCIAAQRAVGVAPSRFLAVGGGTRSDLWLRLLATILDQPLDLPEGADMAGPAGAARLALVAAGQGQDILTARLPNHKTVDPDPHLAPILADRKARFDRLTQSL